MRNGHVKLKEAQDDIIWNRNKTAGYYSVKLCYNVVQDMKSMGTKEDKKIYVAYINEKGSYLGPTSEEKQTWSQNLQLM